MFPVFFSVSSNDIAFADEVWKRLPDDWVYLYSKTGEAGAHMWDEISRRELPQSHLFVIFWSESYIEAEGCVREILQAKDLVQQGLLQPVVLRLSNFPIIRDDKLGEESKPVFEALEAMLEYRTSPPNVSIRQAIDIVQRVAESVLGSNHPQMPRHELLQTLRGVVQKDRFSYYPAIWVSGFNGVGRETLLKEFNRSFVPNGQNIIIEINETSLPKQVRLRIESEAFGADRERLYALSVSPVDDEVRAAAEVPSVIWLEFGVARSPAFRE